MFTPWRIQLLGGLSARCGDEVVTVFRSQRTASLFAFLCCHPDRDWGREELIELFWPESEIADGKNSLRVALSSLRKVLEPSRLPDGSIFVITRTHIRLRSAAIRTDVDAFRAAFARADYARAVALYRAGRFLPAVYDDWAIQEGCRLQTMAEEAEERLCKAVHPALVSIDKADVTLQYTAHNLPPVATRFFGRTGEITQLQTLLRRPEVRTITITGAGGTGKTRLAVEAARLLTLVSADSSDPLPVESVSRFSGGIWFLPLQACRQVHGLRESLLIALRDALQIPPSPAMDLLEQVASALGDKPTLLILDNLEQVADAAWSVLTPLLAKLPAVTFLATSRIRLGMAGEEIIALSPLPLPKVTEEDKNGADATNFAVALFVDRARFVQSDVKCTAQSGPAIADLVTKLEGVPLAIELAAAWANVLTPRQMTERLTKRLDSLPARRAGDRELRHASLGAVVAWSCDLLPADLRRLFYRLSVFRGGFTAESAAEVCGQEDIHAALSRLHQHSLLTSALTPDSTHVRFALMESLREYADSQLSESERQMLAERHLAYLVTVAITVRSQQGTPEAAAGIAQIEMERDNVRSVLEWVEDHPQHAQAGLKLAASLLWYWALRGPFAEGRRYLTAVLALPGADAPTFERADALNSLGSLSYFQGDYAATSAHYRQSIALCRALNHRTGLVSALGNLGNAYLDMGEYDAAKPLLEEALTLTREIGDRQREGVVLSSLGNLAQWQKDNDRARHFHLLALAIRRECGDVRGVGISQGSLGILALERGELDEARTRLCEGLRTQRDMGDKFRLHNTLDNLARIEEGCGHLERGICLRAAAEALRTAIGAPLPPIRQEHQNGEIAALRECLAGGDTAFEAAWAEGSLLSWEDAVQFALGSSCDDTVGDTGMISS